jgi:hypothetical protein
MVQFFSQVLDLQGCSKNKVPKKVQNGADLVPILPNSRLVANGRSPLILWFAFGISLSGTGFFI